MENDYICGIDIGTTNIKGSVYTLKGKLISSNNIAYKSYSPEENYYEQKPDDWVFGLIEVLKKLLINDEVKKNLSALSISTQGGTLVPVNHNYKPLCNAITWLDRRAEKLLKKDKELLSKNLEFYRRTGWRLDSNISFITLVWLKKFRRDIFKNIHKILFVNDYVLKKITNTNKQDPSNASMTLFYNIHSGLWDRYILDLLNFSEDKFSEVMDSGEFLNFLDENICKKLGIRNKVQVINGGHDQYCAGLGSGIIDENELLLSTGTAWVIFKMLDNDIVDTERFLAIGRNIIKNKFGLIYTIPSAGASLKWFADNLMNLEVEKQLYEMMDDNINRLKDIRNDIIFYPYLTGAFGPDFDINKKASLLNLEIGHDFLDISKAIMEGAGFQLKKILNILTKKGIKIEKIKMVGGGAKDKLWPQIIADITNLKILVPENVSEDFASKGAAIIAGYGAGFFNSLEEGYNNFKSKFIEIIPQQNWVKFYKNKFKLFL